MTLKCENSETNIKNWDIGIMGKNIIYEHYTKNKKTKKKRNVKRKRPKETKYCLLCNKPIYTKRELCKECENRYIDMEQILMNAGIIKYHISIAKLIWLKQHYKVGDIIGYLIRYPDKVRAVFGVDKWDIKYAKFNQKNLLFFHVK